MTGMKPGFPRTIGASSDTNPSPGPKMIDGPEDRPVEARARARPSRPPPWSARTRTASRRSCPSRSCGGSAARRRLRRPPTTFSVASRCMRSNVCVALLVDDADQVHDGVAPGARPRASDAGSRTLPATVSTGRLYRLRVLRGIARQDGHGVAALQEPVDDVRSDEARAARDENLQRSPPSRRCLYRRVRSRGSSYRAPRDRRIPEQVALDRRPLASPRRSRPRRRARLAPSRRRGRATGSATRIGGSPDCRLRAGRPGPRASRSFSAMRNPSDVVSRTASRARASSVAPVAGDQRAPGRPRRCGPRGRAAGAAARGRRPRRSRRS